MSLEHGIEMTPEEAKVFFDKNQKKLKKIVAFCEEKSNISRIKNDIIYLFDDSDKTKYNVQEIQRILLQLNINNVQCARSEYILNNKLLGIGFYTYGIGLGVSGRLQGIDYDTEVYRESLKNKKRVKIYKIKEELSEKGWYFFEN